MRSLKDLLFFLVLFSPIFIDAQTPAGFNYQAVLRNSENEVRAEENVQIEFAIRKGASDGTVVYQEEQPATTNKLGLVNLVIGQGSGKDSFPDIDWSSGVFFLEVLVGNAVLANTQLWSVPFARYAANGLSPGERLRFRDSMLVYDASQPLSNGNLISFDGNNWVAKDLLIQPSGGGLPVNNMQPYETVRFCIALQGIYPSRNVSEPFLGTIAIFGFTFAPRGWADCNGQLLPIAQNTALFSLLGTTYGGDGRTTFALPDLRGRVPIHTGQGVGLSNYTQGQRAGSETIQLTIDNLPSHTHTLQFD